MKNAFLKKLLCVLSAAVLLFSFAACGNNSDEAETTVPAVTAEDTLVSEESTQADSTESDTIADTESSEKTEETKEQPQGGETSSKPDSKADIVNAYNSAVAKSGLSRKSMTQTLTKGDVSVVNYNLMADEHAGIRSKINVNNTSKAASDLKALNMSNVKDASRSGNTVTIKLNNFSAASVSDSAGGYVGVIDDARRDEIINVITADIGVSGVKLVSGTYTLQNGVIRATFNDDFTKLTKVEFSASESYKGKLKYLVMSIDAVVALDISSAYSA